MMVPIWAQAQGHDPRSHFWVDDGRITQRLCDGFEWQETPPREDSAFDYPIPCSACVELYAKDATIGTQRFLFQAGKPAQKEGATHYNGYPPTQSEEDSFSQVYPMIKATMTTFVQFCNAKMQKKQEIVRDQRVLAADPRLINYRDFYGPLRRAIIKSHLRTQDNDCLRDSLLALQGQPKLRDSQRTQFQRVGHAYTELWESWDATPFEGVRCSVVVGDLTIAVNPEIRAVTQYGDTHILKLHYKAAQIPRSARLITSYLLNRVKETENWPRDWLVGILDIERRTILPAIETESSFALALEGEAAAYVGLWNAMSQEDEEE